MRVVFRQIDSGLLEAITSPVTLAECLVLPLRQQNTLLQQDFIDLITTGNNTQFVTIDRAVGQKAAELRARYNLALPDALQVSVALTAGCDALLTNDKSLQRVTELQVLVLDDLTIERR